MCTIYVNIIQIVAVKGLKRCCLTSYETKNESHIWKQSEFSTHLTGVIKLSELIIRVNSKYRPVVHCIIVEHATRLASKGANILYRDITIMFCHILMLSRVRFQFIFRGKTF